MNPKLGKLNGKKVVKDEVIGEDFKMNHLYPLGACIVGRLIFHVHVHWNEIKVKHSQTALFQVIGV